MLTADYQLDVAKPLPEIVVDHGGPQVWITSDQHFGHRNIIALCKRPWGDVALMREGLIHNHNELVAPDDLVLHLGDFAFLSETDSRRVLSRLNGVHYLIPGNHDPRNPVTLRELGFKVLGPATLDNVLTEMLGLGWQRQQPFLMHQALYLDVSDILVSHYPRRGSDAYTDRHDSVSPSWTGPMLHGHVHHQWQLKAPSRYRGAMYNVGVDVHGWHPIPLHQAVTALRDAAIEFAEQAQ